MLTHTRPPAAGYNRLIRPRHRLCRDLCPAEWYEQAYQMGARVGGGLHRGSLGSASTAATKGTGTAHPVGQYCCACFRQPARNKCAVCGRDEQMSLQIFAFCGPERTGSTPRRSLTGSPSLSITLWAMPTYEYICEKCGHHFDLFQSISAQPLTVCPKEHCGQKTWGKGKVKRAISGGAGLIFKGSGFYITDYRSEKYKEAAKKDSAAGSSPSTSSSSSGKSESKPASSTASTTKSGQAA